MYGTQDLHFLRGDRRESSWSYLCCGNLFGTEDLYCVPGDGRYNR